MATAKQRGAKRPVKKFTKKQSASTAHVTAPATATPAMSRMPAPKPALKVEAPETSLVAQHRLPGALVIGRKSVVTLRSRWKLFAGILAVYLLLSIVLVEGLNVGSSIDASSLKSLMSGNFSGGLSQLWTGLSVFTVLVAAIGNNAQTNSSDAAALYQVLLALMASLAIIWALRQVLAGHDRIRIRDSFYRGMYPIIPFLLVIMAILAQLLPFIIGGYIYGLVISSGVAVHAIDRVIWAVVLLAGLAASLYLLSSSVLALYIVALPDMTPFKALRSARELVRGRRLRVLRRLLFLPMALFITAAVIMVPIIIVATGLTPWVFFVLSIVSVAFIHSYLYTLYRELIA